MVSGSLNTGEAFTLSSWWQNTWQNSLKGFILMDSLGIRSVVTRKTWWQRLCLMAVILWYVADLEAKRSWAGSRVGWAPSSGHQPLGAQHHVLESSPFSQTASTAGDDISRHMSFSELFHIETGLYTMSEWWTPMCGIEENMHHKRSVK